MKVQMTELLSCEAPECVILDSAKGLRAPTLVGYARGGIYGSGRWGAAVRISLLALVALALGNCGRRDAAILNEAGNEAAEHALTRQEAADILDGNSTPGLHCDGPWTYSKFDCFNKGRRQECGIETPAQVRETLHYQPCRRPEFGIEKHKIQAGPHKVKEIVRIEGHVITRGNPFNPFAPVLPINPDALEKLSAASGQAHQQCLDRYNPVARANLPETSYATCDDVKLVDRNEAPRNTYVTFEMNLRYWDPLFNIRYDDPRCPQDGPPKLTKTADEVYFECRHHLNGREAQNICGAPETAFYSRPGLRSELPPEDAYAWQPGPNSTAVCSTCDELPWHDASEIAAKFLCLRKRDLSYAFTVEKAAGLDQRSMRTLLTQRIRLLFELTTEISAEEVLMYYPRTGAANSYGLGLCTALTQTHVLWERVVRELPRCLALESAAAASSADAASARGQALAISEQLVERIIDGVVPSDEATLLSRVGESLHAIEAYYNAAYVPAEGSKAWHNSDELLARLWRRLYDAHGAAGSAAELGVGDSSHQGEVLAVLLSQADGADALMLRAAYMVRAGESMAPHNELILAVTADALQSLADKIERRVDAHDFSCLYGHCTPGEPTRLSELNELLGAVGDPARFSAAFQSSRRLPPAWQQAFGALAANAQVLAQAVAQLQDESAVRTPDGVVSTAGARLASLVRVARSRAQSYTTTGLFSTQAQQALRSGLDESRRAEVMSDMDGRRRLLELHLGSLATGRQQLAADLIRIDDHAHQQVSITNRVSEKQQEVTQLTLDLQGRRAEINRAERTQGDFLSSVKELVKVPGWQPEFAMKLKDTVFVVSPRDARFDGQKHNQDSNLSSNHVSSLQPFVVNKGDSLLFAITGSWSPTCALSRSPGGADLKDSIVGPEGFTTARADSDIATRADQDGVSDASSATRSTGEHGSFGISVGGLSVGKNYDHTKANTHIKHHETLDSNTLESRNVASFSTGLRLDNVPFPSAPAGALLAVVVVPGNGPSGTIKDVHVMHAPTSAILFSDDAEVYFVVNDLSTCERADSQALTVSVTHMQSASPAMEKLAQAMGTALGELRARMPALRAQGRILPQQMASLASDAQQRVAATCGDLARYPQSIRAMFDAWVSKEQTVLESQAECLSLERRIANLELEIHSLEADKAMAQGKSRLLTLAPLWTLRNLDASLVGLQMTKSLTLMNDRIWPVMSLLYPSGLTSLYGDTAFAAIRKQLLQMREGAFDDTPEEQARRLVSAMESIHAAMQEARLDGRETGGRQGSFVALRFERPGYASAPAPAPGAANVPAADAARASAVWHAIQAGGRAEFSILPEDLYAKHGGRARLSCNQLVPVVSSMGLLLEREDTDVEGTKGRAPVALPTEVTSRLHFATGEGMRAFRIAPNFAWHWPLVMVGSAAESYHIMDQCRALQTGQGLSPFATFAVDFAYLQNSPELLQGVRAITVLMELDYRVDGGRSVSGVRSCQ